MRVLVTGAGGLLGGRLAQLLSDRFDIVAGRHEAAVPRGIAESVIDLLSPDELEPTLDRIRPDAVVHSAALADVDRCEREPGLAARVNTFGAEVLARLCHARGIRLVALSTDLVFDGSRPFATESDPTRPLLTYARTKLEGEEAVLALAPGSVVARLPLVHGRGHGPRTTASETVAFALAAGRRVPLFTDQFRTPVDPESIAGALARLLCGSASGRFHLGGGERISRHALGLRVAARLGLRADLIEPARQADQSAGVPRPLDVSLDSSRARRELDFVPRPLDAGIAESRVAPG